MTPIKPSEKEEEYFARQEFERRKQQAEEERRKMAEAEKKRLRDLHFMHCPKCGMDLLEIELQGISVDKCPSCSGIWFDEGEVERLSEKESGGFLKTVFGWK